MKVCLLTLGCKVNQAETAQMESQLRSSGIQVVGLEAVPDLCIVNTCAVTAKSDYQSRQLIRRAHRAGARVLATGCYAELNREQVGRMEGVEAVMGNDEKHNVIKGLFNAPEGLALSNVRSRTRLFLKVQDGCNHACSYCVIPRARGRSRSVEQSEVIQGIERAAALGYKEVVLSGIHLGLYGLDLRPKVRLSELLEEILDRTAIERIRLSSLEIREIDDRLLALMDDERVARHLHIPLQSGDDRILRFMNRNYTSSFFREAVKRTAERMPDIALGTDIIAGFPGETEEAFGNTLRLAEELPFTYLHAFPFSPRPGTPASTLPGSIPHAERSRRVRALRALGDKKKESFMQRQVGQTLGTLLEEQVSEGLYRGTSSNYLKVHVGMKGHAKGNIVPVRIEGRENGVLRGKVQERR